MNAILHIGTIKTGTTSIQKFLHINRNRLSSAGYHYLESTDDPNHRALASYCMSDDRRDDFFLRQNANTPEQRAEIRRSIIENLEAELESLPPHIHTVLISSEHFHFQLRSDSEMDRAHELMSRYFDATRVICYLREQGEMCTAYYSTALRGGHRRPYPKFLRICNPNNIVFNYDEFLNNWSTRFGRAAMDVAIFHRSAFLNNDLLDDFTARIDDRLVGQLEKDFTTENESLAKESQVLLHAVNSAFPAHLSEPRATKLRNILHHIIYRFCKGHLTWRVEEKRHEKLRRAFRASNENVRREFFPEHDTLFLNNEARQEPASPDPSFFTTLRLLKLAIAAVGPVYVSAAQRRALKENVDAALRQFSQTP